MCIYIFDLPALGFFWILFFHSSIVGLVQEFRTGRTRAESHRDVKCIWKTEGDGWRDGQTTVLPGKRRGEERAGPPTLRSARRGAQGRCAADCRRLQLFCRHRFPHACDNIQVSGLGNTNPSPPLLLLLLLCPLFLPLNGKKGKIHRGETESFCPPLHIADIAEDEPDDGLMFFGGFVLYYFETCTTGRRSDGGALAPPLLIFHRLAASRTSFLPVLTFIYRGVCVITRSCPLPP